MRAAELRRTRRDKFSGEMEPPAALRQLVGQIQELWDLYGSSTALHQRWCLLDIDRSSVKDDGCDVIMKGKSEILNMVEDSRPPPAKKFRRELTSGKLNTAVSSIETMEQLIWKELPEDLFEAVIARLPVASFFRLRSVCKKWNSLPTSFSFSQHYAEVRPLNPWFYTATHEHISTGAMYDPSSEKWHHPYIPFLPSKLITLPVASAGGLVCFMDIGNRNFYTCNPLTNSFKELPPRSVQIWSRVAVGMVLNGNTTGDGYKIVWLGCNGDHEIYDSVANTWARPRSLPASIKVPLYLNFRSQTVAIGNTLYFRRADPDGIVSYNIATGVWKQFIIPSPMHLTDHTLAECQGKVMLLGLLSKNAATCVCVWELQRMTLLWKEVDRMPNLWCLDFYGKHVRMTCLGNQGLLMLSLRSRRLNRLVTYDVMNKEWKKVPDCITHGWRRQWIACGTAFHPCPTAIA